MSDSSFLSFEHVRNAIIGRNFTFRTPYGERLLTYADYTASGRSLSFIEQFLIKIQREYANTHTEDDITGRNMTTMFKYAKLIIKRAFNGEENCKVITIGTGATGAILKLQEILGVRIPPATIMLLKRITDNVCMENNELIEFRDLLEMEINKRKPIVFIGPYEHHSNDIMWREAITEVVTIKLTGDGYLDLTELEEKVSDPRYSDRIKIGSFSAASNVTGIKSPIYEIARIMHKYDGIVCFDFAASAPYVKIDMNKDQESYIDAICLSPHKFVGGPGSTGILVFNKRIYDIKIPPTYAGGGTVDYVCSSSVDYVNNIEIRENAGTPGILQTIKAALVIDLKDAIGIEKIEEKELDFTKRALERFSKNPNIEILGPLDPPNRIAILSFRIKHENRYLHPKLTTKLLNDLFGIQSRAGCMCAGPYGHFLLNIDEEKTQKFRNLVQQGIIGLKPGWCRVNFHYSFSETEFQFICQAIEFIANNGYVFLSDYSFNYQTGEWKHLNFEASEDIEDFNINSILQMDLRDCFEEKDVYNYEEIYNEYIEIAKKIKKSLKIPEDYKEFKNPAVEELRWFNYVYISHES
ncbi:MAG: aminotransferase class V-fold PLP-dependent enzyme [Promethearchaeota archaeon]